MFAGTSRLAHAQADSTRAAVHIAVIADGRPVDAFEGQPTALDSLHVAAREVVASFQREGYYFARVDSHGLDTSQTPPTVAFYVSRGEQVSIGRLRLEGVTALDSLDLLRRMDTRPGRVLDQQRLEADIDVLLRQYEEAGFPLTKIRVRDIHLLPGDSSALALTLHVEEGGAPVLVRVEPSGAERTTRAYLARVAELREGKPLIGYDPVAIQQRLEATAFFQEVGLPELYLESDTGVVVRIPLVEEAPGAFDLVLGYLPPEGGTGRGSLVGNGHLLFRNLFGGGRQFSLQLNRLPGQVSSVDVRTSDPYLLGLPVSVEGRFEGIQQDSTYGKQGYGLEVGYRLRGGLHLFGTVGREVTRPGQGGFRLVNGRQRVARATAFFAGIGVRIQRVDRRINPRRGFFLDTNFEQGRKERLARRATAEGDTTNERTLLRQERLRARGRAFLPTFSRQVLVLGGDVLFLRSNEFDASDLFRFGGATSLRGYDEEQFLVPFATRMLVEYRYQLDRTSYGFVFFDLGYVERSRTINFDPVRGFFPGYGLGFQVGTGIGLINLSLAANTEEPTGVRAHLGFSIGL